MILKKNVDQFKRIIRAISAIVVLISTLMMFMYVWIECYNEGIVLPFIQNGHYLVGVLYLFFTLLFMMIYNGLDFGYLKKSSIILSQILAYICSNIIIYFIIVLLSAKFVNIKPIIWLTVIDFVIIFLLATIITWIFKKLFPAKKLLLLYEDYEPNDFINKINTRKDRYVIKEVCKIDSITEEELLEKIKNYDAVVSYDIHSETRNKIVKFCYSESVRLYTTPKVSDILIKGADTIHMFDSPLLLMRNSGLLFEQKLIKRIFDIVVSIVVLIITSPIYLCAAIAIKLYDGGPVLFRQDRCTINGKVFSIHKFRSMIIDAEKEGKSIPATENDPRITPVGAFLRKTRIDELPQMIDILQGNMSLVGPRPERVEHVKAYTEDIPEFAYRLKVKGGLTGFAQIYGKYNTTAYDKLKLDLMYIQNYSFALDLKLLFMTVKIMFMKESTEGFEDKKSKSMTLRD